MDWCELLSGIRCGVSDVNAFDAGQFEHVALLVAASHEILDAVDVAASYRRGIVAKRACNVCVECGVRVMFRCTQQVAIQCAYLAYDACGTCGCGDVRLVERRTNR